MTHEDLYNKHFKQKFPQLSRLVVMWFPNGKDSIRVRKETGEDFIFTYHSETDWCFETVDSFIKKLRRKEGV